MVKNAAFKSRVMSSSLTMVRGKWYNVISIYKLITVPISETKKTRNKDGRGRKEVEKGRW